MTNFVNISIEEYENLKDNNRTLLDDNRQLRTILDELKEDREQKVIIREIIKEYDSNHELSSVKNTTKVKGFESVKEEVYNNYKEDLEKALKKIDELEEDYEALLYSKEELHDKCLELQLDVARLKSRSLWERILNK